MENPECQWCGRNHSPFSGCHPAELLSKIKSLQTKLEQAETRIDELSKVRRAVHKYLTGKIDVHELADVFRNITSSV